MARHTAILAGLLRHLGRSDFGKAVQKHQADKGVGNPRPLICSRLRCTGSFKDVSVFGRYKTHYGLTLQNCIMPVFRG
jgi:hypothetical protein